MIKKIDHLGIVVENYEEMKTLFTDALGLEFIKEEVSYEWNCKMAFYQCGEVMLELVTPIGPGEDQDYLDRTGGGLQHVAFEVNDIKETMRNLSKKFVLKDEEPRPGASDSLVFFLEPTSIGNMETEFMQYQKKDNE